MDDPFLKLYFIAALLFFIIIWMNEPTFKKGQNTFFEIVLVIFVSIIWPASLILAVWFYTKKREKGRF